MNNLFSSSTFIASFSMAALLVSEPVDGGRDGIGALDTVDIV